MTDSLERSNRHLVNVRKMISDRGAELRALSDSIARENARLTRFVASAFRRARWRTGRLRLQIFCYLWRLIAFYAVCIGGGLWLIYIYRADIINGFLSFLRWVTELIRPDDAFDSLLWPL